MKHLKIIIIFLLLALSLVIITLFQLPDNNLRIIACDVGQGDAILMVYKNIQILTDGGPDNKVLSCLGRHIPFWDRNIELVILTHPDSDHSMGLVDVIKRYKVDKILINPIDPGTDIYRLLEKQVVTRGIGVVNPYHGMKLRVGMIYLDIFSPTDELLNRLTVKTEGDKLAKYFDSTKTNLYSIVYKLSFGKFNGLFPGDMPPEVSDSLSVNQQIGTVNYIKIPHHGSSNGLTDNLLKVVMPRVAVISVSSKNIWGFPTSAILSMLAKYNVKVLRTDQMGDVEVVTDGNKIWWKN